MSVPGASGKHVHEKYVYPLKLHFYTVKLGCTLVFNFSCFLIQNTECGYLLEPPRHLMAALMDMLVYAMKQKESIQCSWL